MMMSVAFKLLLPAAAHGWSSCVYPKVDWILSDTATGQSATSTVAGMGPFAYIGGYTQGAQTLQSSISTTSVSHTDSDDTTIDLHLSKISSAGVPTAIWNFPGSVVCSCYTGSCGMCTKNNFNQLHKFPDLVHLAFSAHFKGDLTIPGISSTVSNPWVEVAAVGLVGKFNTDTGQAVWVKMIGDTAPGGGNAYGVDGDTSGNLYVSGKECQVPAVGRYGSASNCTRYIEKLASSDGAQVWRMTLPSTVTSMGTIRIAADNSGYGVGTLEGTAILGSTTYSSHQVDGSAAASPLVIKWDSTGSITWAKVLGWGNGLDLDLSLDNAVLVVYGDSSGAFTVDGVSFAGSFTGTTMPCFLARLSTTDGTVSWGADMPYMRGIEVSNDNAYVVVFGQTTSGTSSYTLTDAQSGASTMRSRGSYDLYVAKMSATDGSGVWALDGGGDGMEYFWGFGMDVNDNILVSGYSRSSSVSFGESSKSNSMHSNLGGDGKNTIYTIQLSGSTALPSCLGSCTSPAVPTTGCFIDNTCVTEGANSPYHGHSCYKCTSATSATAWTGPDLTAHCYINGACVADGAPEMISGAYGSMSASACRSCQVSRSTSDWTVAGGYHYVQGTCVAQSFTAAHLTLPDSSLETALGASAVVKTVVNALGTSFADAKTAYVGSLLQTLATTTYTAGASRLNDIFVAYYGSPTWLDDYMMSALDGTGQFAGTLTAAHGLMSEARTEAIKKCAQDQILVMSALRTLEAAPTSTLSWDMAYAYWVGNDTTYGNYAPWERANKRCTNYGTCGGGGSSDPHGTAQANLRIMAAITAGKEAASTSNATAAQAAYDEFEYYILVVYYQASLRYAYLMDEDLSSSPATATAEHQGEGGAFWRLIEPMFASPDPILAAEITSMYTMTSVPTGSDAYRYCLLSYLLNHHLKSPANMADFGVLIVAQGVVCLNGLQVSPLVGSGITSVPAAITTASSASDAVKNATGMLSSGSWANAKSAYTGSILQTLAQTSWAGTSFYDQAVSHFGSASWLDDYILSALDATGEFAGELDTARGSMNEARTEAFKKGVQDQILVTAALSSLLSGETSADNWRLMWAYWTGNDPSGAPWLRANKRCTNYGTCGGLTFGAGGELANVNSNLLLTTVRATQAIVNGNTASLSSYSSQAEGNALIVYYQAALRYAFFLDNDLSDDPPSYTADHQGEGGAFWRVIAPVLHAKEPVIADYVTSFYTMTTVPSGTFHYCPTHKMLTNNFPTGMDSTDFGTLSGTSSVICTFPPPPPPAKEIATEGSAAVSVSVKAAGAVEDYTDAVKGELECNMAALADVTCGKVSVSVSAGSVILDFTILAADSAATDAITAKLNTAISSASTASAALGVTVEEAPTIAVVSLYPPPPPPEGGLSTGAIVGIAIGGAVGLLLIVVVVVILLKKKTVIPKEHAPPA
jgi:hypothetical protein